MFLRFNAITEELMFTVWRPMGHWPCLVFSHFTRRMTAPLCCTFRTAGCCLPGLVQQIVVLPGEVEVFATLSAPSSVTVGIHSLTMSSRGRGTEGGGPHAINSVSVLHTVRSYHSLVQYETEFRTTNIEITVFSNVMTCNLAERYLFTKDHSLNYVINYIKQSPSAEAIREVPRILCNWRLVTMFARPRHWSVSWARWIQFTPCIMFP
jgi:hypothetical protein